MKSGRNIAPFLIFAVVTLTVCTSAFSAVPRTLLSSTPALVSYAHTATVPNDRKTFRYAVSLYDAGMYERAAEIFASLSGAGAIAWDNGALAAGDSFDAPANGLGALEIDFDGATDIEALGYYVLCAVKMQTRGYTVLANSYILKYPYGSLVPQIRFAHATLCFDLGDYKAADNQLEPLSRRKLYHNQIPDFLFMRALCSLELGEETAAARFTDIINYKRPNRYVLPAHYFLGYINYENGNISEAREHFALAVADPRFKSLAEHYLVECGGSQTTTTTATTATTSTTTATENATAGEATYKRILDSYDKGEYDDVEDLVLDFAESDNPDRYWLAKSFIILGDSYAEQGDFAKALTTFESVRDGYNPAEPDDVKDELEVRIRRAQEMLNKN